MSRQEESSQQDQSAGPRPNDDLQLGVFSTSQQNNILPSALIFTGTSLMQRNDKSPDDGANGEMEPLNLFLLGSVTNKKTERKISSRDQAGTIVRGCGSCY